MNFDYMLSQQQCAHLLKLAVMTQPNFSYHYLSSESNGISTYPGNWWYSKAVRVILTVWMAEQNAHCECIP